MSRSFQLEEILAISLGFLGKSFNICGINGPRLEMGQ